MTRSLLFDALQEFFPNPYQLTRWADNYPPTDIVKIDDNNLNIEMALAGLSRDDISVTKYHDRIEIEADPRPRNHNEQYLRRGISKRSFKNTLGLSQEWQVNDVIFKDGLLTIQLRREVPEELKPKLLQIR